MPTYEILQMPLKPGSNIGDESNEAAQVLKGVCDTLHQTDGCQSIDFGTTVEGMDSLLTGDKRAR